MTPNSLRLHTPSADLDPASVLRAAVQRDYLAFERGVYLQARRAFPGFRSHELAGIVEETVNETVHRALRAAPRFDPERPALPWLFSFATNVLLERRTSRVRQRTTAQTDLQLEIDEVFADTDRQADGGEASEERQSVRAVLQLMPQEIRQLLEMKYFEQLDNTDMAHRLQISEGALRVRVHRAKEKFRDVWLAARATP